MLTKAPKAQRGVTNLLLDQALIAEAKKLELDVSRNAEEAITEAVRVEKNRRWKEENREATESWNEWTREHGLPLAKYRPF